MTMPGLLQQQPSPFGEAGLRLRLALQRGLLGGQDQGLGAFAGQSPISEFPPQQQPQQMAPISAPAARPDMLARIFGGSEQPLGLLQDPSQMRGAGRDALLMAGLGLLSNTQRPLGQALAAGLLAGRESYQMAGERAAARQQAERMAQFRERLASSDDLMTDLPQLIQAGMMAGDEDGVKALTSLYQHSQGRFSTATHPDLGLVIYNTRDGTYNQIMSSDALAGLTPDQASRANDLIRIFNNETGQLQESGAAYAALLAALNRLGDARISATSRAEQLTEGPTINAIFYNYAKLLDPSGRLSDQDVNMAQRGGTLLERARNLFGQAFQGQLDTNWLAALNRAVSEQGRVRRQIYDQYVGTTRQRAGSAGIPLEHFHLPTWGVQGTQPAQPRPARAGQGRRFNVEP